MARPARPSAREQPPERHGGEHEREQGDGRDERAATSARLGEDDLIGVRRRARGGPPGPGRLVRGEQLGRRRLGRQADGKSPKGDAAAASVLGARVRPFAGHVARRRRLARAGTRRRRASLSASPRPPRGRRRRLRRPPPTAAGAGVGTPSSRGSSSRAAAIGPDAVTAGGSPSRRALEAAPSRPGPGSLGACRPTSLIRVAAGAPSVGSVERSSTIVPDGTTSRRPRTRAARARACRRGVLARRRGCRAWRRRSSRPRAPRAPGRASWRGPSPHGRAGRGSRRSPAGRSARGRRRRRPRPGNAPPDHGERAGRHAVEGGGHLVAAGARPTAA